MVVIVGQYVTVHQTQQSSAQSHLHLVSELAVRRGRLHHIGGGAISDFFGQAEGSVHGEVKVNVQTVPLLTLSLIHI